MTTNTKKSDPNDNGWEPCAPGTLGSLRRDLRSRQAKTLAAQVAGGLTAVAVLFAVGFGLLTSGASSEGAIATITCQRCCELMPSYHDHLIGAAEAAAISPNDIASVTHHLGTCWMCRREFEELYPGALAASAAAAAGLAFVCTSREAHRRRRRV
jgi:hypothetical protein